MKEGAGPMIRTYELQNARLGALPTALTGPAFQDLKIQAE